MSIVFVISAPSGAGKSTLVRMLMDRIPGLHFSVSSTTRPPRPGEVNGVDYHFVTTEQFQEMIQRNEFLEYAVVHGHFYGTHIKELEIAQQEGKDLILDIDIQGARQVRSRIDNSVGIFILPPSPQALKERLEARAKDRPEEIARRLQRAVEEVQAYKEYDYVIINDDLERAFQQLAAIVQAERLRTSRMEQQASRIVKMFLSSPL